MPLPLLLRERERGTTMADLIKISNQAIKALRKTPAGRKIVRSIKDTGNRVSSRVHNKIKDILETSRDKGPKDAPGVTYGGRTSRSAVISRHRVADYTKKRRIEGALAGLGAGAAAGAGTGYVVGKSKPKPKRKNTGPALYGAKKGGKIMQGYKAGGKV